MQWSMLRKVRILRWQKSFLRGSSKRSVSTASLRAYTRWGHFLPSFICKTKMTRLQGVLMHTCWLRFSYWNRKHSIITYYLPTTIPTKFLGVYFQNSISWETNQEALLIKLVLNAFVVRRLAKVLGAYEWRSERVTPYPAESRTLLSKWDLKSLLKVWSASKTYLLSVLWSATSWCNSRTRLAAQHHGLRNAVPHSDCPRDVHKAREARGGWNPKERRS